MGARTCNMGTRANQSSSCDFVPTDCPTISGTSSNGPVPRSINVAIRVVLVVSQRSGCWNEIAQCFRAGATNLWCYYARCFDCNYRTAPIKRRILQVFLILDILVQRALEMVPTWCWAWNYLFLTAHRSTWTNPPLCGCPTDACLSRPGVLTILHGQAH